MLTQLTCNILEQINRNKFKMASPREKLTFNALLYFRGSAFAGMADKNT